tara:strand:- start:1389 stop:1589 length:201 start_codon:yes stop_codon:yes gene_type:complete
MNYLQVDGEDGLYRDTSTGAIINKDKKAFEQIRAARLKDKYKDIELEQVKTELAELKEMIRAIINK